MDYIISGIISAIKLLLSFDKGVYEIIYLSLFISGVATLIGFLIIVPLGLFLGIKKFYGERIFSRIIFSLMGIPSVVIGLTLSLLLSRRSVFGFLEILYTPTAIIIAEVLLIMPIALGLSYKLSKKHGRQIRDLGKTLGATPFQRILLLLKELRGEVGVILITCFTRAITEVGAVMIVGGNIKGQTRVITTSISMSNSMGEYTQGIALGIILFLITFLLNNLVHRLHEEEDDD